jgi:PHD/YefM family antitoxin component YafN of YafNO toxin-antitoxin module
MNTIPREPVVITKHGRKHAIVLPYEEAIELGEMSIDSLSKETQEQYKKNA